MRRTAGQSSGVIGFDANGHDGIMQRRVPSAPMARLQAKALSDPDEVRRVPNGTVEIYNLDDVVVGRLVFHPGWRWSTDVGPIAGTSSCPYHHLGVSLSGRCIVRMDDGTTNEIVSPSAFEIPPGHDAWVVGDEDWVTYDFAGMRTFARETEAGDALLASILFTDVVDSTTMAERLGDKRWRDTIAILNERCQRQLDRHRGRLVKTTGDGLLALFDSTERAVRCASAMVAETTDLGLAIRAGVHTGEVERVPGDIRGLAVHLASRVMAAAGGGEVLVSDTTHALLLGGAIGFEDRGEHELKGITGARRLWVVVQGPPIAL